MLVLYKIQTMQPVQIKALSLYIMNMETLADVTNYRPSVGHLPFINAVLSLPDLKEDLLLSHLAE